MLRYATRDDLRQQAGRVDSDRAYREASRSVLGKRLFLSHSRADLPDMGFVVKILQDHGAEVYVDALDQRLPEDPSPETARILKSAIKECLRFVVFLTLNTKDSRWIPWELGIADISQGTAHVALFPSSDSPGLEWAEREYLGLYSRIVWGNFANEPPQWLVYDHRARSAQTLRTWINPLAEMFE